MTPTTVPGISEIVTDGVTGFMTQPHSPQGLAQAIERALDAPAALRDQLIENAFIMVRERFDLDIQAQRLAAIYEAVLSDKTLLTAA